MALFFNKKVWIGVVILVLIVGGILIWKFWIYEEPFVAMSDKDFTSGEQYMDYLARLEKEYAKDNYGGATPEETLELFISALKAGDTELAAKYFVVEKQKQMMEDLAIGKQNDVLKLIISDLERIKSSSQYSDGSWHFITLDEDGFAEFDYRLVLNSKTNKWKITDL